MTEATRLAEIEARLNAAKRKPTNSRCWEDAKAWSAFVDAAPDDIRYLLDRIRELEAAHDE